MAKENSNFEAKLFNTADKLRKNIDAAEYKNVVLAEQMQKEKILDEQIIEQLAKIGYVL